MSRGIRFRVWNNRSQKYVTEIRGEELALTLDAKLFRPANGFVLEKKGVFEVEQFIGLTDQTGKEIYENDIVSFTIPGITHGPEREDITNALVWYDEEDAVWTFGKWMDGIGGHHYGYTIPGDRIDTETFKVLGNIHENPFILS